MSLLRIRLIKALRTNLELQVAHKLIDEVGAFESGQFKITDRVIAFLVVHIDKG